MCDWGGLGALFATVFKRKKKQPSKQIQDSSRTTIESNDQSQVTTQKGDASTQYVAEKGSTINIYHHINIIGNRDKIDNISASELKKLTDALNRISEPEKTEADTEE